MKIALFSAFPQELAYVKKNAQPVRRRAHFPMFLKRQSRVELLAVETGMGRSNLESAFAYVSNAYRPDLVLSIGFGGALYYRAGIGDLVLASKYLFLTREGVVELPQLSAKCSGFSRAGAPDLLPGLHKKIGIRQGSFITLGAWIAKAKLRTMVPEGIPFPVCDLETIHLAKMAYMNCVPFYAVRSITDTLDDEIPEELFSVTDESGSYSFQRAVSLLLSRPSLIPESLKLGRNAARASRKLGDAVHAFMEALTTAPSCAGRMLSRNAHT